MATALRAGIAAAWLALAAPAGALTIRNDHGGMIVDYVERYASLTATGEQVVIDGVCNSACTLVLGLVPGRQACITPRARFGFHKAFDLKTGRESVPGTAFLLAVYPPHVRAWIARHGGLSRSLKIMPGKQSGLKPCKLPWWKDGDRP
jgi:hypothetical protein